MYSLLKSTSYLVLVIATTVVFAPLIFAESGTQVSVKIVSKKDSPEGLKLEKAVFSENSPNISVSIVTAEGEKSAESKALKRVHCNAFAIVCARKRCSLPIIDPYELNQYLFNITREINERHN